MGFSEMAYMKYPRIVVLNHCISCGRYRKIVIYYQQPSIVIYYHQPIIRTIIYHRFNIIINHAIVGIHRFWRNRPRLDAPVVQDASDFGDDFFNEFDTFKAQDSEDMETSCHGRELDPAGRVMVLVMVVFPSVLLWWIGKLGITTITLGRFDVCYGVFFPVF